MTLHGVGAFPRLASPRVLWVGIERHDALISLQKELDTALERHGFSPEKRSFKGHLTLARLKGNYWPEELRGSFLNSSAIIDSLKLPARQVKLFKSELKPGGAVYTELHTAKLDDDKTL